MPISILQFFKVEMYQKLDFESCKTIKAIKKLIAEDKVFARKFADLNEKVKKLLDENEKLENINTKLVSKAVSYSTLKILKI